MECKEHQIAKIILKKISRLIGGFILPDLKIYFKDTVIKTVYLDFPGGAVVKNLPAYTGDIGSIPDPGRSHMQWGN